MIYDYGTEVTISPPTGTALLSYSDNAYDLRGGSDEVAALEAGDQLYFQCEVTTSFAADAGTPLAQIGVVISTTNPPTDDNTIVLGLTGGAQPATGGTVLCGILTADLAAGDVFYLPIPRFDDWMNAGGGLSAATLHTYRYLGLICYNVAGTPGSNDFTTAGVIKARICHRAANTSSLTHTYGSRMGVS